MNLPHFPPVWTSVAIISFFVMGVSVNAARQNTFVSAAPVQTNRAGDDRAVAAEFAPIFYQALGDKPRSDYITNFDFDGDWRGDNNWINADNKRFPLKAYVYYSVAETVSHFFIHYAVFHPRDYKGGATKGAILSALIREGAKRGGKFDPTGLAEEAALAHENDLEGCLVVVEKNGNYPFKGRTVYVQTLHHNTFSRYVIGDSAVSSEVVILDDQRPLLYIEPKGHGIEALDRENQKIADKRFLIYKFGGRAEDPAKVKGDTIGYELAPIQTTLWAKAQFSKDAAESSILPSLTYGVAQEYDPITIEVLGADGRAAKRKFDLGNIGSAFLGKVGGHNMARPPWAWFDRNDRDQPLGQWFFDPAQATKRSFRLSDSFSTVYIRLPFWAADN